MTDIAPELLKKVQQSFEEETAKLWEDIKNSVKSYEEAYSYAIKVGEALSKSFGVNITPEVLPDGMMYYNIADKVVRPMLKAEYDLTSQAAVEAQRAANKAAGIGMKPQAAGFDDDRAQGIIDRVSSEPFEKVKWILDEPVRSFSKNVVDSTIQKNVEFQGKSGLSPKIRRTAVGETCEWCKAVAGTYSYPQVPKDVYRRHANCDCIVEYIEGGKIQNVHTKQVRTIKIDDIIKSQEEQRRANLRKRGSFNSKADPMRDAFGEGEQTNPEEIATFRREAEQAGVKIIEPKEEYLAYQPGLMPGTPGQLIISKGASYSAWRHEMKHMRDDRDNGWQGYRVRMDGDLCYQREIDAYEIEIQMALDAGREDIAEALRANLEEERKSIYGEA